MWPRNVSAMTCASCQNAKDVIQTAYGARANCETCKIRWTSLFSEEGEWTAEHLSPMTDNVVPKT